MVKKALGVIFLLGAIYVVWTCRGILLVIILALAGIACLTDDEMHKDKYRE